MTKREPTGDGRQLTFDFAESPGEASERELRRQLREIGITAPEVAVLVYIWKFKETLMDNKSSVRASMERIAFRMKCSKATIFKGVKRLKQCGLIETIEDSEPFAYQADWGLIRSFSITESGEDLHHKFAQLAKQREESPPEDVHTGVRDRVHGRVHEAFAIGRTAAPSRSSFEAFSEAESEKEEENKKINNQFNSLITSSFLNREIFGALESRHVEQLPLAVWTCSETNLIAEIGKYLQAIGLSGTNALSQEGQVSLLGAILAARKVRAVQRMDSPERYVLTCLRRGVKAGPLADAQKMLDAWRRERSCV